MSLLKEFKILFLAMVFLISVSSIAFAVENSRVGLAQEHVGSAFVESTGMDPTIQQRTNDLENKVNALENKVNALDARISDMQTQINNISNHKGYGLVSFLFGAFCALWAQNTRRNAIGWFIGGALLNVIAVLILLWHNSNDQNQPPYTVT